NTCAWGCSSRDMADAVQTARWMCENDALDFDPHIGIAGGRVTVGYVGTQLKYNCSVFGAPVALAARCAAVKPEEGHGGSRIVFPASHWENTLFDRIFAPSRHRGPDGKIAEDPPTWELLPARKVGMKNLGEIEVREVERTTVWLP